MNISDLYHPGMTLPQEGRPSLIVIDDLWALNGLSDFRNRKSIIRQICSELKKLALEFRATILLLAEQKVPGGLHPEESPQANHVIHHDQELQYLHDHADKILLIDRPKKSDGTGYET
jgi:replicative DNA helicase